MPILPNDIPIEFRNPAHEALMNVLWTGTMLKKTSRTFFRQAPLSEAEFNLLMVLHHSENPLSQNDLSDRLLVDKSNVTGLIDRLEKAKLIRRNAVPNDRRRYHITLTEAGCELVDELNPAYYGMVSEVMSGLSEREYRTLVRLTRKVRHGLRSAESQFPTGG